MNNVFDPLFGFSNMAEVLVCLEKLSLLVHPIPTFPAIASALLTGAVRTRLAGLLKPAAAPEADNLGGRDIKGEFVGGTRLSESGKGAKLIRG